MRQLTIPGILTPRALQVAPGRSEPVVWVRRLRILRTLSPDPASLIRAIELRRGLNVVWAPPRAEHASGLGGDGIAGHTAGKTTLCRLLRHALGEPHFADEGTSDRIRTRLPEAWLLAEVVVAGEAWAVARPLGPRLRSFCWRGGDLDAVPPPDTQLPYSAFQDALESVATRDLPARQFPRRDGDAISWSHLIQWVARDQECRFSNVLKWRHADSGSDAPILAVDERHFVVRAVLGLITEAERKEQRRHDLLRSKRRRAEERLPWLEHDAERERQRLARAIGGARVRAEPELLAEVARRTLDHWRDELATRRASLAAAERARAACQTGRDEALLVQDRLAQQVRDLGTRLEDARRMQAELERDARGQHGRELLANLFSTGRTQCGVPIELARASGCPLIDRAAPDFRTRLGERTMDEAREAVARDVARLEEDQRPLATRHAAAEEALHSAERALTRARTHYDRAAPAVREAEMRLTDLEHLVTSAERARMASERTAEQANRLGNELRHSAERQGAMRARERDALGRFATTFERVARALLGEEIEVRVESAGPALALHVERNGRRHSAGITTAKLLAFDLAALTARVEGVGQFPGLLVHDSPREAALAPDVYECLFLYAQELEQAFAGEPGFQYVVTTTTPPPDAVRRLPWLRLTLSGGSPADRLFCIDF